MTKKEPKEKFHNFQLEYYSSSYDTATQYCTGPATETVTRNVATGRNRQKRSVTAAAERSAGVAGTGTKLLLNADELVVLGVALTAAGSASLDLAGAKGNDKVSNEGVLRLTRPVRNHDTPLVGVTQQASVNGLSDGANLVDLEEKRVARFLLQGSLDALGVGDQKVVAHNLDGRTNLLSEHLVRLPVVLVEGVLDGNDGVLAAQLLVVGDHLGARLEVGLGKLEAEVVGLGLLDVELRSSDVHGNLHLTVEASLLDGLNQKVKRLLGRLDVGGEPALVADVGGVLAVLGVDDLLEVVVDLAAHADGLTEGGGAEGQNHELLHGQAVASVRAAVDDVQAGNGEGVLVGGLASELSKVLVERDLLVLSGGAGSGHGDDEDGVGAELGLGVPPLVDGAVQVLHHQVVQRLLLTHILAHDPGRDGGVDILDGLQHTLAEVAGLVPVAELQGLVDAGGGARGAGSPEDTISGAEVNLDRGIATGVCKRLESRGPRTYREFRERERT
ncbi:uncharacterized protein BcabD6B2_09410 [Babesia caballi]|uniref:Uncharacterized protein n=1 Tax=Babesia caballi TaxID=5871 RepID=A0AAV4LNS9_BABCB|nr:hypothetical protein BcabD6B2_09410 [Babesia caballi]